MLWTPRVCVYAMTRCHVCGTLCQTQTTPPCSCLGPRTHSKVFLQSEWEPPPLRIQSSVDMDHEPTAENQTDSENGPEGSCVVAVGDPQRSVALQADEEGSQAGFPLRRSRSSILRRKKYAVRQSLLANIFFPHHAQHHVASIDEAKEGRKTTDTQDSFLERAARCVQSKQVQYFFVALLVLDVFIIIAELIIETNKQCLLEPIHDTHHVPVAGYHTSNQFCNETELVYLGPDPDNHKLRFYESTQAYCPFEAIPELSHELELAVTILSWFGKAIVIIFAAELVVLIAGLRCYFFQNKMYVLDFVIIAVSLVVDWTVSDDQPSAHLIIFVRCWRFARILHGVGISVHEVDEIEVEHAVDENGNITEDILSTSIIVKGGADRADVCDEAIRPAQSLSELRRARTQGSFAAGGGSDGGKRTKRVRYRVIRTSKPISDDDND